LQVLRLDIRTWALVLVVALTLISCGGAKLNSAADSPDPQTDVTRIENKGSDTIVNLALAWAEAYMPLHSNVRISVTGGGSGTGIAALINGTVDLANASREMTPEEIGAAKKNGIDPVQFTIARDAIAVIVNPQNPITELTIPQLSDIFVGKITNWSELGGPNAPIVLLSRESNSGTYAYFLENVIRRGNSKDDSLFSPETLLMPSSEGISNEIRQNPNCIGYDGLGYVTPDLKTIKIAVAPGKPYIEPSVRTVENGTYPISRGLYMYSAGEARGALKDYLAWIMGPDGQKIVTDLGFVPLTG
jgi:phosphate transport system substrate-binding protein